MNSLAKQGEFAVNFSEMKLPSSVSGTSSLGAFVGTVDRKTLDSAVSKIVGSSKIGLPDFGGGGIELSSASDTKDEVLTYAKDANTVKNEVLQAQLPGPVRRTVNTVNGIVFPQPPLVPPP
jgi:hypothetical protein